MPKETNYSCIVVDSIDLVSTAGADCYIVCEGRRGITFVLTHNSTILVLEP